MNTRPISNMLITIFLWSGSQTMAAGSLEPFQDSAGGMGFELKDLENNSHTLSSYRGKVVLVNFCTSWCTSCLREFPSLERLSHASDASRFALLAITVLAPLPERAASMPLCRDIQSRMKIVQLALLLLVTESAAHRGSFRYYRVLFASGTAWQAALIILALDDAMLGCTRQNSTLQVCTVAGVTTGTVIFKALVVGIPA